MEQAKAADGYLPKRRSNHLPGQRREREKKKNQDFKFADTAVLCCHPAADSGTAAKSTVGTSFVTRLFSFFNRLMQANM